MTTLDEIQARADKAVGDGYRSTPWRPILNTAGDRHGVVSSDGCVVTTADKDVAELLAHAPTDIGKLVAALRNVEELCASSEQHAEPYGDTPTIFVETVRDFIREALG